jgi:NADH:ubiquinone oxidoreductase subunit 4 (subunit M)
MPDLSVREWAVSLPLLLLMFWMGIYTQTFMPPISAQNARILQQYQQQQNRPQLAVAPGGNLSVSEVANAR